jgi:hypothetical protein
MRPRRKQIDPNTLLLLKNIGIGVLVISAVALMFTAVWYGTRLSAVTIIDVEAHGGETIDVTVVERTAQEILDGDYLGVIPYRFAWLYPKEQLREKISEIERVYNVTLKVQARKTLLINFDEYVPYALWCQSLEEQKCVFLDADAYGFAHAPQLSGGNFMRFVTSGRTPTPGETLVEADSFANLETLVTLLEQQGWFISHIEIDQVGDVFLAVVGGGEFKVLASDDPVKVVENLLVVLESEQFQHIAPGNFQYIDLRFGNKVFVNEELAMPETDIASETEVTADPE